MVKSTIAATHLYRIAQEAINNALKHAHPTQLVVRLERRRGGKANLSIQDNGLGSSVSQERPEGIGLRTIA